MISGLARHGGNEVNVAGLYTDIFPIAVNGKGIGQQ